MRRPGRPAPACALLVAAALATGLGASTGCMPYAVPPMRIGAGGGAALGEVVKQRDAGIAKSSLEDMFHVRLELMPLDAFPSLLHRDYDIGLGYVLEFVDADFPGDALKHGPVVSGTYYPLRLGDPGPDGEEFIWRLGLTFRAELLLADVGRGLERGGGMSVGTTFGFASFLDGPYDSDDGGGYAYGEGGVEAYLEGSLRSLHGGLYYLVTAGLLVRLPASVGFFFFW